MYAVGQNKKCGLINKSPSWNKMGSVHGIHINISSKISDAMWEFFLSWDIIRKHVPSFMATPDTSFFRWILFTFSASLSNRN